MLQEIGDRKRGMAERTKRRCCSTLRVVACAGAASQVEPGTIAAEVEMLLVEHPGERSGVAGAPDPGQPAGGDEGGRVPDSRLDLGIQRGELGLQTGFAHRRFSWE